MIVLLRIWERRAAKLILDGGNKGGLKEGAFFLRGRIQLGLILRDNPAGHCFILKDLIPMNFLS